MTPGDPCCERCDGTGVVGVEQRPCRACETPVHGDPVGGARIEEIRANCQGWFSTYDPRLEAMEYLLARLAVVEELHPPRGRVGDPAHCPVCLKDHPCPTVRAARGAS